MADLHPDTEAFLLQRDVFRQELATALLRKPTAPPSEEDKPADEAACVVPARPGAEECGTFLSVAARLECFRDAAGWPNADELYNVLINGLSGAEDSEALTAAQQITLMRQVSVLESYRKMLLHKKQGMCQYLAALCNNMANEPNSLNTLRRLMLNEPVGRLANDATAGNQEDDEGGTAG